MDLSTKISHLVGIGPTLAKRLERLDIFTVKDLLEHYPFRYDDFSNITTTLDAKVGEKVTLQGEIWSISNAYTRFRKVITKAIFNDGESPIELIWFNQPWLTKSIVTGDRLQVSGKINKRGAKFSIPVPLWEKLPSDSSPITHNSLHTGRLVPVYPETYGLTSRWIRQKIAQILPRVLNQIIDPLPDAIRNGMILGKEAVQKIHFPENYKEVSLARERLGFDELFFIQLATIKTRKEWNNKEVRQGLKTDKQKLREFIQNLPFKLTRAQQRVIDEIVTDLKDMHPMNRLVQGEVGSGKTVVAAAIAYLIYLNKQRTLFMAPTEILAFQHFDTLTKLLSPYGIEVGIYTGSRKFNQIKKNVIPSEEGIQKIDSRLRGNDNKEGSPIESGMTGLPDIIIGTHALLSEKLLKENIGLVIIDEQQRFGVEQRTLLRSHSSTPHFLTMTATPIPRTVALTLYGDLDLSIIDEMPEGRKQVKTHLVHNKKRQDAYGFIEKKIKEGDQVYIITPLIDPSETLVSAKAAKVEFENLKKVFPELRLGLLHGRLKSKEKEQAINDFKDSKTQILVSTSVVEVGMDIKNATIIIIEGAERFGLAQLHQLRGRVGRGEKESFCFLFAEQESSSVLNRLKHLEKTFSGLKLAELDLKIRGSGEIFGTRQSGRFELKVASFSDLPLLEKARSSAKEILEKDPALDNHPLLKLKLQSLSGNVMPD